MAEQRLIAKLYEIYGTDPELRSDGAYVVFQGLEDRKVKELYCIIIRKRGFRTYVRFCLAKDLGCRGVPMGLFELHSKVGELKIRMLNQDVDWRMVLWALPCARDLVWDKL